MTAEMAGELGLEVLPLSLNMGDQVYHNYLDGREIGFRDFYAKLRSGALATTSAISVGVFDEAMRKILDSGRDVLYLAFSSALSTTYQSAVIAADDLREAYPDLPVYIHERERLQPGLSERYFYGGPCRTWADGDIVPVGDLAVQVLETPGHTAGSVVLLAEDVMLSGDTLFATSCGRCDLPGGDMLEMFQSLRRLGLLEKDYKVYPGHGGPTTLAQERLRNPYLRRALQL